MGVESITSAITQSILLSAFFYEFDANILREIFSQLSGHKNISRCLNLLLIVRNQEAKKKHTVKGDSGFNKLILHAAE